MIWGSYRPFSMKTDLKNELISIWRSISQITLISEKRLISNIISSPPPSSTSLNTTNEFLNHFWFVISCELYKYFQRKFFSEIFSLKTKWMYSSHPPPSRLNTRNCFNVSVICRITTTYNQGMSTKKKILIGFFASPFSYLPLPLQKKWTPKFDIIILW